MRAIILILGVPIVFAACSDDGPGGLVCMQPVEVNYDDQGTFTTDTLKLGGVTVTGSNTIYVLNLNGLGVVGGADGAVDGAEWIRFAFDTGAAVDISYYAPAAGNGDGDNLAGEATIEAFEVAGTSLGTVSINSAGSFDVSGYFNDDTLSAFVVAAQDGDDFRISRVTYTPCQ